MNLILPFELLIPLQYFSHLPLCFFISNHTFYVSICITWISPLIIKWAHTLRLFKDSKQPPEVSFLIFQNIILNVPLNHLLNSSCSDFFPPRGQCNNFSSFPILEIMRYVKAPVCQHTITLFQFYCWRGKFFELSKLTLQSNTKLL